MVDPHRIFGSDAVLKTSRTTPLPAKPYSFAMEHASDRSIRLVFFSFRTHLIPRIKVKR